MRQPSVLTGVGLLDGYYSLSVAGGQGVEVGEDEVAGAVAGKGFFVFAADGGERL